jgi:hypothetical protein
VPEGQTSLSDTSAEAEGVLREVLRTMPFARKWRQMGAIYHTARVLHAAGLRDRNPSATDEKIQAAWVEAAGGGTAPWQRRRTAMVGSEDNLRVLQDVVAVLDRLQIAYALGGSWASSILGKMRFTHDADLSAEPFPGKEADFCAGFGEDYYVSLPAVQQAIRQRLSFNVVHTLTGFKVDVFVSKGRPFDRSVLARRRQYPLGGEPGVAIACVSPEDIILLKLEWYRLGGGVSGVQWNDVLGVLQVQGQHLDQGYLDHWAAELGVSDLLERARRESSLPQGPEAGTS